MTDIDKGRDGHLCSRQREIADAVVSSPGDEWRFVAGAERVVDGGATAGFRSDKEISR